MHTAITLIQGDITQQATNAIVNAANSSLMGGGGVDGAIHRAGGSSILEDCKQIVSKQGRLPTGQAVITTAGNLPCEYVIHTVGPVWHEGSSNESKLLADAYRNSLQVAADNNIKTICFPSISTGVYRFPIEKAARIALKAVDDFLQENPLDEVRFVLFSENDLEVYRQTAEEI